MFTLCVCVCVCVCVCACACVCVRARACWEGGRGGGGEQESERESELVGSHVRKAKGWLPGWHHTNRFDQTREWGLATELYSNLTS